MTSVKANQLVLIIVSLLHANPMGADLFDAKYYIPIFYRFRHIFVIFNVVLIILLLVAKLLLIPEWIIKWK